MNIDLEKLGQCRVTQVVLPDFSYDNIIPTSKKLQVQSFWKNNSAVITIFCKLKCEICREIAKDKSACLPQLRTKNIRMVGIGLHDLNRWECFLKEWFIDGELCLDSKHEVAATLGYTNKSSFSCPFCCKAKTKVSPDNPNENFHRGGTLVIKQGGKEILLNFSHENPNSHLDNSEILAVVNTLNQPSVQTGSNKHNPKIILTHETEHHNHQLEVESTHDVHRSSNISIVKKHSSVGKEHHQHHHSDINTPSTILSVSQENNLHHHHSNISNQGPENDEYHSHTHSRKINDQNQTNNQDHHHNIHSETSLLFVKPKVSHLHQRHSNTSNQGSKTEGHRSEIHSRNISDQNQTVNQDHHHHIHTQNSLLFPAQQSHLHQHHSNTSNRGPKSEGHHHMETHNRKISDQNETENQDQHTILSQNSLLFVIAKESQHHQRHSNTSNQGPGNEEYIDTHSRKISDQLIKTSETGQKNHH